jgi:hypothetical protein
MGQEFMETRQVLDEEADVNLIKDRSVETKFPGFINPIDSPGGSDAGFSICIGSR